MIAKLCAVLLIILIVLPFTEPFSVVSLLDSPLSRGNPVSSSRPSPNLDAHAVPVRRLKVTQPAVHAVSVSILELRVPGYRIASCRRETTTASTPPAPTISLRL
jgi:hypothetical protein